MQMTINHTAQPVTLALAKRAIVAHYETDMPLMLSGPPGVGKSDVFRQACAEMKIGFIDFRASLRDQVALLGVPRIDLKTNTTVWVPPNELPNAKRDGKKGIFLCDEITSAPLPTQVALYGLILDRVLGEYRMESGWVPMAAGNLLSDKAAVTRLSSALKNRFGHFQIEADLETWCDWAVCNGVDPLLIAFLRWRPYLLHIMPGARPAEAEAENIPGVPADANAFPSPRSWTRASAFVDQPEDLRVHLIRAQVGDAMAGEFEGFYRVWRTLPTIQAIIANPGGTPVPNDPASLYALSAALARAATRQNFDAILTYASRFGTREFSVVLTLDAVKRDPTLQKTGAYAKWAIGNQDIAA